MTPRQPSCDIFCRVVDNFGDIGVTWRLARQLANERGLPVRLIVDDLGCFARIAPAIDSTRPVQTLDGVTVLHWQDEDGKLELPGAAADLVIEAFACEIPPTYLRTMATRSSTPVWINLEYLSAEAWVATHHFLPSPHPSLPLTKYFFFPGFDAMTGGLLRETGLIAARDAASHGRSSGPLRVFVFGYAMAPMAAWLDAVNAWGGSAAVTMAEGDLAESFEDWRGSQAKNVLRAAPALEFRVAPFVPQPAFDALLWQHDILFVRGEDSFVRAQWAAKPFVWQIYPQADGAHWPKLNAFLDRYCQGLDPASSVALREMWRVWNAADVTDPAAAMAPAWRAFCDALPALRLHALEWAQQLEKLPDLASNLLSFYRKIAKI